MNKQKYEISLWEERLLNDYETQEYLASIQEEGNGIDYLVSKNFSEYLTVVHKKGSLYYSQSKIAVIGADDMTSVCRAVEPKMTLNVNGTHKFTFKMYYTYVDNITGEKYENPFLNLLVNERHVKVYWPQNGSSDPWYELIIKSCEEDSDGKSITYTCEDLFINELAKTGFDLEFDNELENNQGTVHELGAKVVDGTDWQVINTTGHALYVDENGEVTEGDYVSELSPSEVIKQTIQEATYLRVVPEGGINAYNQTLGLDKPTFIPAGKKILIFYSCVPKNLDSTIQNSLQFLYAENYVCDSNSMLVNNADCYIIENINWEQEDNSWKCYIEGNPKRELFTINNDSNVSNYRGNRLVSSQNSIYDPLSERYCEIFKNRTNGHTIYKYVGADYNDVPIVANLLVNPSDYPSTNGWVSEDLLIKLYPIFDEQSDLSTYNGISYLNIGNNWTYNIGLQSSSSYLSNGIQIGDRLIFRFKAYADNNGNPNPDIPITSSDAFDIEIWNYTKDNTLIVPAADRESYIEKSEEIIEFEDGYYGFQLNIKQSATRSDLYNKNIGVFIKANGNYWIRDIQLFNKVLDTNGQIVLPNSVITNNIASVYYWYYDKEENEEVVDKKEIKYLYKGLVDYNNADLEPVMNKDFCKIRSITEKQSNRFNILQSLAETFECWVKFHILHDENGTIIYKNDRPQKYITFVNEIGVDKGLVFRYGTDLKSIRRSIKSDTITTKTIVQPNNIEYATDGVCTIARAANNPSKENFILNFDYYLTHNLLDQDQLNRDLYTPHIGYIKIDYPPYTKYVTAEDGYYIKENNKYILLTEGQIEFGKEYYKIYTEFSDKEFNVTNIGYYYWLNKYNTEYDTNTKNIVQLNSILTNQNSSLKVCKNYTTALADTISSLEEQIKSRAAAESIALASDYISTHLENNPDLAALINSWQTQKKIYNSQLETQKTLEYNIELLEDRKEQISKRQKEILLILKKIHSLFFKRYGHYIQEGTWTSSDYIDDNLYYLDAVDVSYTSSRPQISYDIEVLRLSTLEEFKGKNFNVGDICYIEDVEFFGYIEDGGKNKTPYKEKVLVSELTVEFDDPTKDKITVQNYKTQFEDLFQRIAATSQSLQYASGDYARAAAIVSPTGTIDETVLQNSIALNQDMVISANHESVISDATGITVTDTTNASNRTKLTSGGVFISTDGGASWKNAIRGDGIATQYLTSGLINTNTINIYDGNYKTFRWDKTGINAYDRTPAGINTSKFVRFDHYGIYGLNGVNEFIPTSEEDIWNNASYALTWKGFMLKSSKQDGYFSISSDNDLQVFSHGVERVKLGLINEDNDLFGLRINDAEGRPVIYTGSDGNVSLNNTLYVNSQNFTTKIGYFDNQTIPTPISNLSIWEYIGWNKTQDTIANINKVYYYISGVQEVSVEEIGNEPNPRYIYCQSKGNIGTDFTINDYEIVYPKEIKAGQLYFKFSVKSPLYTLVENKENIAEGQIYYVADNSAFTQYICNTANKEFLSGYQALEQLYTGISLNDQNYYTFNDSISNYYYLENEEYIKCTTAFDPNITYYTIQKTHAVINANDQFIVWEDGSITANDGYFRGTVYATDGEFTGIVRATGGEFNNINLYRISSEGKKEVYARLLDGLKIFGNSSIEIYQEDNSLNDELNYINKGHITEEEFNFNPHKYFIKDNNFYKQIDNYQPGIDYYIYNPFLLSLTTEGLIFSGKLQGVSGDFSGTITAIDGKIGGFIIKDGSLNSVAVTAENQPKISLQGTEGNIIANQIELGTGATIKDYIALGDAYLYNPNNNHNGKILEANGIVIKQNGLLEIGEGLSQITINGANSTIIGNKFSITPTISSFENVNIQGTLSTVVFETDKVAAAGGSMIFKDSFEILEYSQGNEIDEILIRGNYSSKLTEGLIVYIIDKSGASYVTKINKVEQAQDKENTLLSVIHKQNIDSPKSVIVLGDPEGDLVISVNSNIGNTDFMKRRGITFMSFNEEPNGNINTELAMYLGDLSSITDYTKVPVSGYGLYANNVYLNGTLTTEFNSVEGSRKYAGVNTYNGYTAYSEEHNDNSRIIFWAGSNSTSKDDIRKSNFYVTEDGTLIASQGIFKGKISSSEIYSTDIYGANIYAATIHGNSNKNSKDSAELKIYNTAKGIGFYTEEEDNLFNIGSSGLFVGNISSSPQYFIKVDNSNIDFIGKSLQIDSENNILTICDNQIIYQTFYGEYSEKINHTSVTLDEQEIKLDATKDGDLNLQMQSQKINNGKIEYKYIVDNMNVCCGMDIYIY